MRLFASRLRIAWLCALIGLGAAWPLAAGAGDFSDFMSASKEAQDHNRSADFYLRSGNTGVAVFELQAMADIWAGVRGRFDSRPPDPFAEDPEWRTTLAAISDAIATALAQAQDGDARAARKTVQGIRATFSQLRRRNGIAIHADCIAELNAATDSIWRYRQKPPDLASTPQVEAFAKELAVVEYLLRKCRGEAPKEQQDEEMFKRLFDQSLASIETFGRALRERNGKLLVDTLRELRSFDHMIFLRYG